MTSIIDNLSALSAIKENLKTAIINKGVSIGESEICGSVLP